VNESEVCVGGGEAAELPAVDKKSLLFLLAHVLFPCVAPLFPLAEIFFCRPACLSGQTGGPGTVARAESAARAELQGASKQKLQQLKK
jgi:hypothetical protein